MELELPRTRSPPTPGTVSTQKKNFPSFVLQYGSILCSIFFICITSPSIMITVFTIGGILMYFLASGMVPDDYSITYQIFVLNVAFISLFATLLLVLHSIEFTIGHQLPFYFKETPDDKLFVYFVTVIKDLFGINTLLLCLSLTGFNYLNFRMITSWEIYIVFEIFFLVFWFGVSLLEAVAISWVATPEHPFSSFMADKKKPKVNYYGSHWMLKLMLVLLSFGLMYFLYLIIRDNPNHFWVQGFPYRFNILLLLNVPLFLYSCGLTGNKSICFVIFWLCRHIFFSLFLQESSTVYLDCLFLFGMVSSFILGLLCIYFVFSFFAPSLSFILTVYIFI